MDARSATSKMANDTLPVRAAAGDRVLFFDSNYPQLRDQMKPMNWMRRLFLRLTDGWCPRLVDLPTGAGKTDVVVIWILALSWYGLDTLARKPVPRRLVWVINRRVLVQQVFRLARQLTEKLLAAGDPGPLATVRNGLALLSGDREDFFRIVELRGQLVDDRDWSVAPAVPQLIVGTVDQIGRRLLFQGYGLGKWSVPLQASLLAVDAWLCVDEAHLVPAFVLTLRQARQLIEAEGNAAPTLLSGVFERLPFWLSELSATPALPPPSADSIFRLLQEPEDEEDPPLKDRLLAARTRQVNVGWLTATDKPSDAILKAASDLDGKIGAVAVFVHTPKDADTIAAGLGKKFGAERVLKITGRLRGYERDRLEREPVLKRFGPPEERNEGNLAKETAFLVGTAAAEVGLDADAGAIVCDFASLPTLLQRLGRLDRRGSMSRRFSEGEGEAPTMTVFAAPGEAGKKIRKRFLRLARDLRADRGYVSPSILIGRHWIEATAKEAGEKKAKEIDPAEIVGAATRAVLLGKRPGAGVDKNIASPPSTWLKCPVACVTGGPVGVPALTTALIEQWCGTTEPGNDFLPVHPFLYGILPDLEGTPLVSVAFRLEMDVLATDRSPGDEEDDEEEGQACEQISEIFRRFPPQRAEFHFVALNVAREWLASRAAFRVPVAVFDGQQWSVSRDGDDRPTLRPGTTLVLPTLARDHLGQLLESASDPGEKASRDVLEGVSTKRPRYWRLVKRVTAGDYGLVSEDGAARFELTASSQESAAVWDCVVVGGDQPDAPSGSTWAGRLRYTLSIGTAEFRFEYLKPMRVVQQQFLADHLQAAEEYARRIAGALSPGSEGLRSLLVEAAKVHDLGKNNPKWQRAMGNSDMSRPVAKPCVERPLSMRGFRHEWESLLEVRDCTPKSFDGLEGPERVDLWRHLVVSHHGHLRPWLAERVLEAHALGKQKQSSLRLESAECFARLQGLLGPWRLAYLEGLLKAVDVAASQTEEAEESDEQ